VVARYNVSEEDARNTAAFGAVFKSTVVASIAQSRETWTSKESKVLASTDINCATTTLTCTLVAGAGATVTNFTSITIKGTQAIVVATVHGWQADGQYTSAAKPVVWHVVASSLIVHEVLTKQSNGSWLITTRKGVFAGTGP
jgi:hypothetical protein